MKKLSLYIFLVLMFCNVGFAKCVEGDCINGQGTLKINKYTYVGEFKDGKQHGQGTYAWTDGSKYVGEFKDGKHHGQGTYWYKKGSKYVGEWKDNNRHGQGTYTFPDGEKLIGEFKNGEFVG